MNLTKLPSGSWRWTVKHKGMMRRGTAATRELAAMAGAEALLDLGAAPVAGAVTVGPLLRMHVDSQGYSAKKVEDYDSLLRKLPDTIKSWRVRDVDPAVVAHWYRRLREAGWSEHRLLTLHTLMSSAWKRAVRYQWAKGNVFRDVERPRPAGSSVQPPSVGQVRALLDAASPAMRTYLRLAAVSGGRSGELCGLQWGDVALDTGEIVLRRSVAFVAGSPGPVIGEGKTGRGGHRRIGLDPGTIDMLKQHRREQVTVALEHGLPAPLWVFSHDAGVSPWRPDYVAHQFGKLRTATGITGVRAHDLRHYMATTWLAAGEPLAVVQHRLGHRNAATTSRVYSHYVQAADLEAASRHGAALG